MGIRGPKPKPTAVKILEGNRGKRPLPTHEPQPGGVPTCPAWLRKEAKAEWKRIVPELVALGIATRIDREALAAYCQTHAKWRDAEEFLAKHGMTINIPQYDADGTTVGIECKPWPQVAIARSCVDQIRIFCAEFGLTPSSRARMTVPGKNDSEDPLERMLWQDKQN